MTSIKVEYKNLVQSYRDICTSSQREDSSQFQDTLTRLISSFLDFKTLIYTKLSLFSTNESLEDLQTSSIPFLSIDYYLAILVSKKQAIQLDAHASKNQLKIKFLQKSIQLFMQFLVGLQDYEILDNIIAEKIDKYESTYKPTLKELYVQPKDSQDLSGATLKRQQKIEMYCENQKIEHQLIEFESRQVDNDDELQRNLYLTQLRQLSFKAFREIEQNLSEIELLSNFMRDTNNISCHEKEEVIDPTVYTDKLEILNKPLLSKSGKVLRNFTLLNKRQELQNKVYGYGQYGPTMTVEEFLEQEFNQGRVLQGGNEIDLKYDEDNEEQNDKETYKAREWDNFKEENPKGSGNTMNRG